MSSLAALTDLLRQHIDRAGACLDDASCPRQTARDELVQAQTVLTDLRQQIGAAAKADKPDA